MGSEARNFLPVGRTDELDQTLVLSQDGALAAVVLVLVVLAQALLHSLESFDVAEVLRLTDILLHLAHRAYFLMQRVDLPNLEVICLLDASVDER